MSNPSVVIDRLTANVLAILHGSAPGGKFREAAHLRALGRGPAAGAAGEFSVEVIAGKQGRPFWGGTDVVRELTAVVAVAYFRPADRRVLGRNAAEDMARIGDLCESPANYDFAGTGIRAVRQLGAAVGVAGPLGWTWEARFSVEWHQAAAYM